MSHASVFCVVSHISCCWISLFHFSYSFLCNLFFVPDVFLCVYFSSLCSTYLYHAVVLCVYVWFGGGLIRWREKAPWPMEGFWFRHHSGPIPTVCSRASPGSRVLRHFLLHRGVRRSFLWVGRWLMESWRGGLWTLSRVLDRIVTVPD